MYYFATGPVEYVCPLLCEYNHCYYIGENPNNAHNEQKNALNYIFK